MTKDTPSQAYLDLIAMTYDDTGIGDAYAQREKERHAKENGGWFTCPKTGDRVRYHTRAEPERELTEEEIEDRLWDAHHADLDR